MTPPKIKPYTDALRKRIKAMPVPGVLVLEKDDFKPSTAWFVHDNCNTRYLSVRQLGDQMFVFRLK